MKLGTVRPNLLPRGQGASYLYPASQAVKAGKESLRYLLSNKYFMIILRPVCSTLALARICEVPPAGD